MKHWIAWLLVRNNGIIMSGRYLREPAWTPSEQFKQNRLEQKHRSMVEPCTLGSVAAFNESYMDVVDWAYQKVGPPEILWIFLGVFPLWFFVALSWSMFVTHPLGPDEYDQFAYTILTVLIVGSAGIGGLIWFGRILYNTFTGCTHYPVRLDRKNQMVHVFRHNGEDGVSSYRWRDITFGMIGGGALQRSFLKGVMAGYVRRTDGSYDYFRLGVMSPAEEGMRGQWEYFRRYMEEGPNTLPEPEILLPIQSRRESFRMGAQLCWFIAGPMLGPAIVLAPLTVPGSLLRWFVMHATRRLPRWPQNIIDTCQVSPDDRYAHKPVKPLNVSLGLAFFVTLGVLAFDAALLFWFIGWLSQPGYR
ncbi:DUF6708 domain-containing protein [Paraburkholderia saeva]|uniref:DUF6708 domain-containing protein n=1 Tax=Paraburkholderia saeva TaxID=2777537 RepID=UPI001E186E7C|nr:DUF6708 domain-containing protein [Paraburkholderia saeva]CAG4928532.1 hypothetical protein R70241_05741 [Paraburkholderia saeva]CAG4928613.1 hypothetical protein R52603_05723 [Paraburkholderia saeva]